jgi:hypothetical protein
MKTLKNQAGDIVVGCVVSSWNQYHSIIRAAADKAEEDLGLKVVAEPACHKFASEYDVVLLFDADGTEILTKCSVSVDVERLSRLSHSDAVNRLAGAIGAAVRGLNLQALAHQQ